MPDPKDTVAGRADPAGDPPAMTRPREPQPRAGGFRSACYISDHNAQRCNNAKGISAPNKRAALIVPRDATRDDARAVFRGTVSGYERSEARASLHRDRSNPWYTGASLRVHCAIPRQGMEVPGGRTAIPDRRPGG